MSDEEQEERKAHIETYIRIRQKLLTLQLAALRLKGKSKPLDQSTGIDQAIEIVNDKHQRDVEAAKSLLSEKLTPREFLLLIKRRQQKVFDATKQCSDTIERLVKDLSEQPREPHASAANKKSTVKPDRKVMRMHTKTLSESVTNDVKDLSARTMRLNLEARREQAVMLNRSFEERKRRQLLDGPHRTSFAPWRGHCKTLAPHWKAAAPQLKWKVKLGALDATVHTVMPNKFGIRGFPTIKYFAPGWTELDAVDRTTSDIVRTLWATSKALKNLPPPEIVQATDSTVVEEQCSGKQLCILAFLPPILDCQAKYRNKYLHILRGLGDMFKKNDWGWIWVEGGSQPDLEEALGVGGFEYPAMVALNYSKMNFSMLKGSFDEDGIREFLRDLNYGKRQTAPIKGATFPAISKIEPWDGEDDVPPKAEDIDLSNVDLEHVNSN